MDQIKFVNQRRALKLKKDPMTTQQNQVDNLVKMLPTCKWLASHMRYLFRIPMCKILIIKIVRTNVSNTSIFKFLYASFYGSEPSIFFFLDVFGESFHGPQHFRLNEHLKRHFSDSGNSSSLNKCMSHPTTKTTQKKRNPMMDEFYTALAKAHNMSKTKS